MLGVHYSLYGIAELLKGKNRVRTRLDKKGRGSILVRTKTVPLSDYFMMKVTPKHFFRLERILLQV